MAHLDELLEKTSRTFALSIPLLPEPTRREVTVAYLIFRIADTFEDSTRWPRAERIGALEGFMELVRTRDREAEVRMARRWAREVPTDHDGYVQLLENVPFVLGQYHALRGEARVHIEEHIGRTARGMAGFVDRTGEDGELRLRDLDDLRNYCYTVAGIVGEMLTELFLLDRTELQPVAADLRERAAAFGEGLQLVNVLKDSSVDRREGRVYLPPQVDRDQVFELARRDLEAAATYTRDLHEAGGDRGLVAFNALPIQLAWATLDVVEQEGAGSKISRPQVWSIVEGVERALDEGRPPTDPRLARRPAVG